MCRTPELLNIDAERIGPETTDAGVPHAEEHVAGFVGAAGCQTQVIPLHETVRDGIDFITEKIGVGIHLPAAIGERATAPGYSLGCAVCEGIVDDDDVTRLLSS